MGLASWLLTAYCICRLCTGPHGGHGITKSGSQATPGRTVACDMDFLRKSIRISGEWFKCEDTGSAIKGRHIDIFMASHSEARRFGRKWTREVEVR